MKKILLAIISKAEKLAYKNLQDKHPDMIEPEFWEIYNLCKAYTMTSVERMYALYLSVDYVLKNNIEGDFVECGVWKGGSAMLVAKMLFNRKITNRKLFLYDTFEGMSEPTLLDKDFYGADAANTFNKSKQADGVSSWCLAFIDEVKANLSKTQFASEQVVYVKGKVEDTLIDNNIPSKIALLRLDTDWYESTKIELEVLYPKLSLYGPLIVDDYGFWQGCRKAVDEYFELHNINVLQNRIDNSSRNFLKVKEIH